MSNDPVLVVDGRPLVGRRTGIGVHVAEVLARLRFHPSPVVATHAPVADTANLDDVRFRVDRAFNGIMWQQLRLDGVARAENAGILWGPHGTLPLSTRIPSVVTIHDLTSITMVRMHSMKTVFSFNVFIGRSLAKAHRIVAVSRHTAGMLGRGFGIPASRIEIIGNAADEFFSPGTPTALPPGVRDGSYILYAGTVEPRKGIGDLLDAWESLGPARPPLVVAGGTGWKVQSLERRIAKLGSEVVRTGWVSRELLRDLYRGAVITVYPSHYEGFGIPLLEAMQCGSPVITTSAGALEEVAGDGAEIVPPGSPAELARAMRRLLGSPEARQDLIERGTRRAASYSWEGSAQAYADVFRDAARSDH